MSKFFYILLLVVVFQIIQARDEPRKILLARNGAVRQKRNFDEIDKISAGFNTLNHPGDDSPTKSPQRVRRHFNGVNKNAAWQNDRIFNLLGSQSNITTVKIKRHVREHLFLINPAQGFHPRLHNLVPYHENVFKSMQKQRTYKIKKFRTWHLGKRQYTNQLMRQHNKVFSTQIFGQNHLHDPWHLKQLPDRQRKYKITKFRTWHLGKRQYTNHLMRQHNKVFSTQIFGQNHLHDPWHLKQLFNHDRTGKWMLHELGRHRGGSMQQLTAWQMRELRHLREFVRRNSLLNYVQFEVQLLKEHRRLRDLAMQYSLSVEEIENWLRQQLFNLKINGQAQVSPLSVWQVVEQKRLIVLLLQHQSKISYQALKVQLWRDYAHLQQMSEKYHVSLNEIRHWSINELMRLKNSGLFQTERLTYWQQVERKRLQDWLETQHNTVSHEAFIEFMRQDQRRLQQLMQEYRLSVTDVESWVNEECMRLQILGKVTRPTTTKWEFLFNTTRQNNNVFSTQIYGQNRLDDRSYFKRLPDRYDINHDQELAAWQIGGLRYLRSLVMQNRHLSYVQFEVQLLKEQQRLRNLAMQYSLNVEEIEHWLRQQLFNLKTNRQSQVQPLTVWQVVEQKRLIELLLQQQSNINYEALTVQLRRDYERLQEVSQKYHVSFGQIKHWTIDELMRLKNSGLFQKEQLAYWQQVQRKRLEDWLEAKHNVVSHREFLEFMRHDRTRLQLLMQQYRLSVKEVESWVNQECVRLQLLGKVTRPTTTKWEFVFNRTRQYNNVNSNQLMKHHNNFFSTQIFRQNRLADHLKHLHRHSINHNQMKKWMLQKLWRHHGGSVQQLTAWQIGELRHLRDLVRQNSHLSYIQFELQLLKEQQRLRDLAMQYSLSVEEIQNWLRQQLFNLKTNRKAQVQPLTIWQVEEQKRLIVHLLQHQSKINYQALKVQLWRDYARLQKLSQKYHVRINQIRHWTITELMRLKNSGLFQIEKLAYWQQVERKRLEFWLEAQHNVVTHEAFLQFLRHDQIRLQLLIQEFRPSVKEVESWVNQECVRLQLLGKITRPTTTKWKFVLQTVSTNTNELPTTAELRSLTSGAPSAPIIDKREEHSTTSIINDATTEVISTTSTDIPTTQQMQSLTKTSEHTTITEIINTTPIANTAKELSTTDLINEATTEKLSIGTTDGPTTQPAEFSTEPTESTTNMENISTPSSDLASSTVTITDSRAREDPSTTTEDLSTATTDTPTTQHDPQLTTEHTTNIAIINTSPVDDTTSTFTSTLASIGNAAKEELSTTSSIDESTTEQLTTATTDTFTTQIAAFSTRLTEGTTHAEVTSTPSSNVASTIAPLNDNTSSEEHSTASLFNETTTENISIATTDVPTTQQAPPLTEITEHTTNIAIIRTTAMDVVSSTTPDNTSKELPITTPIKDTTTEKLRAATTNAPNTQQAATIPTVGTTPVEKLTTPLRKEKDQRMDKEEPSSTTPTCTTGANYLPHPSICNKFIMCSNSIPHEMNCPPTLCWNAVLKICDYCNGNCRDGITTNPEIGSKTSFEKALPTCSTGADYLPFVADCNKYIQCAHGQDIKRQCPKGLVWDQDNKTCNWTSKTCK